MLTSSGNLLVAALAPDVSEKLIAAGELVPFSPGDILQAAAEPVDFVYFPQSGVVTLSTVLDDGTEVMTCGIGFDGAINLTAGPGGQSKYKARVEVGGEMLRIGSGAFETLRAEHPTIEHLSCAFADTFADLLQQALACKVRHDAESQLCCWLLRLHVWQGEGSIPLTHHALARTLSLRRTTVTQMAKALQDGGVIAYRRGMIQVTDLYALHQASCECFRADRLRASGLQSSLAMAADHRGFRCNGLEVSAPGA